MKDQKKPQELLLSNIIISDSFKRLYAGYFTYKDKYSLSITLNQPLNNIKVVGATRRQICNWSKDGLLNYDRNTDEWRKYSIMEALWVSIIVELRSFGYPIELIKIAKTSLNIDCTLFKVPMPMLEMCASEALARKSPYVLVVFGDGAAIPLSFEDYKSNMIAQKLKNHIYLDLNDILKQLLPKSDLNPITKIEYHPTKQELELLSFLKSGDFEKVEVIYKDGKIDRYKATQRSQAKKTVNEAIKEHAYQEIKMHIKDNKLVSIKQSYIKKATAE